MVDHRTPVQASSPTSFAGGGGLLLAATPIGDVRDASFRLVDALRTADVVAAEDTRRLMRLTSMLEVQTAGTVVPYHEHNEATMTSELVRRMREGQTVLLVTDAGMPSVSDPGYRLVAACVEAQVPLTCLPGPSAVLVSLALSGLPVDRFAFEGFCPRRPGERARRLSEVAGERRTMVFFEAPHRLAATLKAMREAFGAERRAAVCRELTKTYEEVRRGTLDELVQWAAGEVRGEISIVVDGAHGAAMTPEDALAAVLARAADGERLKDACKAVAGPSGLPTSELYAAAVAARRG